MSELDELLKTKSSTLATQRYRLHIFQACLQSAAQRANTAVQYPDNAEFLEARSDVVSTLEALRSQPLVLEPQANSKLEFFIETEEFLYVVNEIGEVSETSPCPDTTTAEGSGLKLVRPGQEASFTITAHDTQGELCGMGGDVFVVELINEFGEEVEVNLTDNGNGTFLSNLHCPQQCSW